MSECTTSETAWNPALTGASESARCTAAVMSGVVAGWPRSPFRAKNGDCLPKRKVRFDGMVAMSMVTAARSAGSVALSRRRRSAPSPGSTPPVKRKTDPGGVAGIVPSLPTDRNIPPPISTDSALTAEVAIPENPMAVRRAWKSISVTVAPAWRRVAPKAGPAAPKRSVSA